MIVQNVRAAFNTVIGVVSKTENNDSIMKSFPSKIRMFVIRRLMKTVFL